MGVYATQWAFRAPIQSPGAKFLLVALAEHARGPEGDDWTCFPSVKRLAEMTAQGERTIERHLSWLIAEGWISRQQRHSRRRAESAYFYTLHPSKIAADEADEGVSREAFVTRPHQAEGRITTRQISAVHPPISTRSPANLASAYMDEPGIEPVSEPRPGRAMDVEKLFQEFWSAYPNKVEERGARRLFSDLVRSGEVSSGGLIAGARAYAKLIEGRPKAFIKSPMNWLAKGCWADVASEGAQSEAVGGIPVFEGPGDVWAMVVNVKGAKWADSYLAPCSWNATTRTLRPRTSTAAITLRREIGHLLRRISVSVSEPMLALGGAHA